MIGAPAVRELDHDELEANDDVLTQWLVGAPGSLRDTYPQIFDARGGAVAFGAFDGELLRSHAAVRRATLCTDRETLRASLVGIVATDPAARGATLASGILHRIADREVAAGQDLIVLWSERWDFYAKLGYARAGVQAEVVVRAHERDLGDAVCRALAPHDVDALVRLHAQKPLRIARDADEMRLLLFGTATDGFVLERDGEPVAYACHGKGFDFGEWWHEVGGDDEDVALLLPAAMQALDQDSATVLVPPYRNDLFASLVPHAESVVEGAVALCKPLTAAGACELFIDGLDSV